MNAIRQRAEISDLLAGRTFDTCGRTRLASGRPILTTWMWRQHRAPLRPTHNQTRPHQLEHPLKGGYSRYLRPGLFPKAKLMAFARSSGFCDPMSSLWPSDSSSMTPRLPLTLYALPPRP